MKRDLLQIAINNEPKKRCNFIHCRRKLTLIDLTIGRCSCDGVYCLDHRFPSDHACTFDHKAKDKAILIKQNPVLIIDHNLTRF